jgi:hypothetical protein
MKRLILVAPALLLSAASADESNYVVQPGFWETTIRFTSIEVPGLSEDAVAQMQRTFAYNPDIRRECITPAGATDPTAGLTGILDCEFREQTFAEGRIRVSGICPLSDGEGQIDMLWDGGYTYTTMTGAITSEVSGTGLDMRMRGTLDARRIGECPDSSEPEEV